MCNDTGECVAPKSAGGDYEWPALWSYSKQYARKVIIGDLAERSMPEWVLEALPHLQRVELIKFGFYLPKDMMCCTEVFDALRYRLPDFVIHIECPTSHIAFGFAKREAERAELRSVTVDIERLTLFKSFGVTAEEWRTVDTLIGNGVFKMGDRGDTRGVKILKLDCTAMKPRLRGRLDIRTAEYLRQLSRWFPNLEHIELDFQDDNGLEHPSETQDWMDRVVSFKKLRHLSLKSIPPFIEGTLIEGFRYSEQRGTRKSRWHTGCLGMKTGPDRIDAYTARAVRVVTNICNGLILRKKGAPLSKVDFTIKEWDHKQRLENLDKTNLRREEWASKCVPQVRCEWTAGQWVSGEPSVQANVASIACAECFPTDSGNGNERSTGLVELRDRSVSRESSVSSDVSAIDRPIYDF